MMPQNHYYDDYPQKHPQQPLQHHHHKIYDYQQHHQPVTLSHHNNQQQSRKYVNIVHYCLNEKDLSKAGLLFSLSNETLLAEFSTTIKILKRIIDSKNYANNFNEQSIVEIVLTRCTSALREKKLIGDYYDDLLELLEICLKYNLNNNRNSWRLSITSEFETENQLTSINTPHANIVSDILSCILLDYLDPSLATKAIPFCIKLLQHHNVKIELLHEICSYLNLVACRSPEILIDYVFYIVNAVQKGHTCLTHLLFQICEANIECIYPLTRHLVKSLKIIQSATDLTYVLQIIYLISLNHVQLIIVHLEDIIEYLFDDNFQDSFLDILFSIANQSPIALEPYLFLFGKTNFYDSYKVDKIISTVGRSLKKKAEFCTGLLIERIKIELNRNKQIKNGSLTNRSRLSYCLSDKKENREVAQNDSLEHHLLDQEKTQPLNRNAEHYKKSNSYSFNPLSRKHLDVEQIYTNDSSNVSAKCAQILNEICVIAQVHPQVLETYMKTLINLFPSPSDNIKELLGQLNQLQNENSSREESKSEFNIMHQDSAEKLDSYPLTSKSSKQTGSNNQLTLSIDELDLDRQTVDESSYKIDNFIKKFEVDLRFLDSINEKETKSNEKYTGLKLKEFKKKPEAECESQRSSKTDVNFDSHENSVNLFKSPSKSFSLLNSRVDEENEYSYLNVPIVTFKMDDSLLKFNGSFQSFSSKNEESCERDIVQQFCTKHIVKIRKYMESISKFLPVPVAPTEEVIQKSINFCEKSPNDFFSKKFQNKKYCSLYFKCYYKSEICLYNNNNFFEMITFFPSTWIHLIFLSIQSKMTEAIKQKDHFFIMLKLFYEKLNEKSSLITLVTSSFPSEKQITQLVEELQDCGLYDLFEFSEIQQKNNLDNSQNSFKEKIQWNCFLCSHPLKANELLTEKPLIEGQLKEKHGKWKFLKKWNKRFFTLNAGNITYFKKDMRQESLNVRYIRTIQTLKSNSSATSGHKSSRGVIKSFEIFTDTNSFVMKAQNTSEAKKWIQYLQISKALENCRKTLVTNNKFAKLFESSL